MQKSIELATLLTLEEIRFRLNVRKPAQRQRRDHPTHHLEKFSKRIRSLRTRLRAQNMPSNIYVGTRGIGLVIHRGNASRFSATFYFSSRNQSFKRKSGARAHLRLQRQ